MKYSRMVALIFFFLGFIAEGRASGEFDRGYFPISEGSEASAVKLYYEMQGHGEDLLLLHAGFSDSRDWHRQVHSLSRYFRVITLDFRGSGGSTIPRKKFRVITRKYRESECTCRC